MRLPEPSLNGQEKPVPKKLELLKNFKVSCCANLVLLYSPSIVQTNPKLGYPNPSKSNMIDSLEAPELKPDGLIQFLIQQASQSKDSREKANLFFNVAQVHEHQMGDLTQATEYYRQSLKLDPQNYAVQEALLGVLLRCESWLEAISCIDQLVGSLDSPKGSIDLKTFALFLLQKGRIYFYQLKKPKEAAEVFEQVLQLEPENSSAQKSLKEIYLKEKNWSNLVHLLNQTVEGIKNKEKKIPHLYHDQIQLL